MVEPAPVPARGRPTAELLGLTQELAEALRTRGEILPPNWPEEAAGDLANGELPGFVVPAGEPTEAGGLGFYSRRGTRAYAHLHLSHGPRAVDRALGLLAALIGEWTSFARRADVGLSGLSIDEEERLTAAAVDGWGGESLRREAMEWSARAGRPIHPEPAAAPGRIVPLAARPFPELADLDWRAFIGGPDARLLADDPEDARQSFAELLDGRLGRLLEEASGAFVGVEDRLLGLILVTELRPGRAVILDLAVDPSERRHRIGLAMLTRALAVLEARSAGSARLWVTEGNHPARRLYDRLGFVPVEAARIYRWGGPTPARGSQTR